MYCSRSEAENNFLLASLWSCILVLVHKCLAHLARESWKFTNQVVVHVRLTRPCKTLLAQIFKLHMHLNTNIIKVESCNKLRKGSLSNFIFLTNNLCIILCISALA